jgi:tetratricopeptide (TPR) repeat protein
MKLAKLAIAILVAAPLVAHADDSKALAASHIAHAQKLHEDKQFAAALDELKTAYALDPQPQLLFGMGQLHVQLGQCAEAITYYQRFIATKPSAELSAQASEAIDACKTNPPPPVDTTPTEPSPPTTTTTPPTPPPPEPPASHADVVSPWYADYVGDGLVAGGVVVGVTSLLVYRAALADRDDADSIKGYQAYADALAHASSVRTEALVLGAAAIGLAAAGAVHIVLHDSHSSAVQIGATAGGAAVTWTGRF